MIFFKGFCLKKLGKNYLEFTTKILKHSQLLRMKRYLTSPWETWGPHTLLQNGAVRIDWLIDDGLPFRGLCYLLPLDSDLLLCL